MPFVFIPIKIILNESWIWLLCYGEFALQPNISGLLDRPLCEGIPVLQPSRFYRCPSGRNHFKVVRGLDVWKLCLAMYLQNLWFIFCEKISDFRFCC